MVSPDLISFELSIKVIHRTGRAAAMTSGNSLNLKEFEFNIDHKK